MEKINNVRQENRIETIYFCGSDKTISLSCKNTTKDCDTHLSETVRMSIIFFIKKTRETKKTHSSNGATNIFSNFELKLTQNYFGNELLHFSSDKSCTLDVSSNMIKIQTHLICLLMCKKHTILIKTIQRLSSEMRPTL